MSSLNKAFSHVVHTLDLHDDDLFKVYSRNDGFYDHQDLTAFKKLVQVKAISAIDDHYFIQSDLRKFLDFSLNKERIKKIDPDVGTWLEYLRFNVEMYKSSLVGGDEANSQMRLMEVQSHIWDFSYGIQEDIEKMTILINSNFSNVKTYSEKRIQNKFYISAIDKLAKGIATLSPSLLRESCQYEPAIIRFMDAHVTVKLPLWQTELQNIIEKLKKFLFEIREIEKKAKMVRGFAYFLRQRSDYDIKDYADDEYNMPAFLNRVKPLVCMAHPDPSVEKHSEELLEIAGKLPPLGYERDDSANLPEPPAEVDVNSHEEHAVESPAEETHLRKFVMLLSDKPGVPMTAMTYHLAYINGEIDARLWLLYLYGYLSRLQSTNRKLNVQIDINRHETNEIYGNDRMFDITLTYKGAAK